MKKIVSFLMIFILLWVNSLFASNNSFEDDLTKEVIVSKINLQKNVKNSDKLIQKIDNTINNLKNNPDKLEKVYIKIVDYRLNNKNLSPKTKAIINYILIKIELELYKIKQQKEQQKLLEQQKKLEKIKEITISKQEQEKVATEIIKLQQKLLDNTKEISDKLISDFEKYTNYEQTWDIKVKFNLDEESIWKIKSIINYNNIKAKNSWLDSQVSMQIEALLDASLKWQEAFNIQLSTFLDFISKQGSNYILLKDFDVKDLSWNKDMQKKLEELTKQVKEFENKYLRIDDKEMQEVLKMFKSLTPNEIYNEWKIVLNKPFLEAYAKEGSKYLLRPTKYACDKFMELNSKLNPWYPSKCSNSQYEDLLKSLAKDGEIYLEIWNQDKLWYKKSFWKDIFDSYVIFDNNWITKVHSSYDSNITWEWFELSYIKNEKLAIYLNAWKDINIKFEWLLNKKNQFTKINAIAKIKEYNDELNAKFKLENRKFEWWFTYKKYSYDLKTLRDIVQSDISWNLDYSNNITKCNLNIHAKKATKDIEYFTLNLNKNYNNYDFYLNATDDNNINEKIITTNIKLQNKQISGNTIVYNNWKEFLKITSSWRYDTKFLDLKNDIQMSQSIESIFMNQNNMWETQEKENMKLNLGYDTRYNKANSNLYFEYKKWSKTIIELEIDSKWTIKYKKVEIKAPSNYEDINNLIPNTRLY